MVKSARIRIVADSQQDALEAIEELRAAIGFARLAIAGPQEGRRGQWLAYGVFQFDPTLPTTTQAATHAATGPTTRLVKP